MKILEALKQFENSDLITIGKTAGAIEIAISLKRYGGHEVIDSGVLPYY